MSAVANRGGAPIAAVVTSAGTINSTPNVYGFFNGTTSSDPVISVRPCLVSNKNATAANVAYVKVNQLDASGTVHHVIVPAGTTVDVSFGGRVNVQTLSVFMAAGAASYADINVWGWKP